MPGADVFIDGIEMRASKDERVQAEQVTAAVDQLVRDPDAVLELPDSGAAEALAAARQMARLPALLGPADPAFEQRVMGSLRRAERSPRRAPWLRVGWAVAALVVVLLVVMLLTPAGQSAVAGL
ncbi:MAG: hypothetical protein GWN58_11540, partial [Anaerolineae bacterium]|nr:hypothetical protein [Anaerolineae bacterium]